MSTLAAVPVVDSSPGSVVVGVAGSGLTVGVTVQSAYPEVAANQITWFRQTDLATPLTEAADSRYDFSANMRSLYIYPVTYDDEGDYIINIYHVTGNQSVNIHINVQGNRCDKV